ncbi:MAG: hypothetical protein K2N74_04400, partial [Clostridiales bacterium]|nr:hypothetical protein [Clostridiales bacterium]
MKKLRTALIVLFTVLVSLGVFAACKKKDPEGETAKITSVRVEESITLTDSDTAETLPTQAKNLRVTIVREGSKRETIKGSDCTFDTSAIQFGKVGAYTVKVIPAADNPDTHSAEVEVMIEHDFGEADANGVQTCKNEDKATKTT